jgi:hypothetical protein
MNPQMRSDAAADRPAAAKVPGLLRAAAAGVLMGIANLIPGVSGGTMILAMGVYEEFIDSVASAKGSHHGVTDEAWTRLARRMVFTTAQYVMQRYGAWRHNGRPTAPPEREPVSPRRRWLPRAIRRLIPNA